MKRVAVIVAGTLGAAAFAFPSIGFAKTTTHSPGGIAKECSALNKEVTILTAKLAGSPSADAAAIYNALIDKAQAKEAALGCP